MYNADLLTHKRMLRNTYILQARTSVRRQETAPPNRITGFETPKGERELKLVETAGVRYMKWSLDNPRD